MIFTETKLKGAFVIELERRDDERGFFARSFCRQEFQQRGMNPLIAQSGIAKNREKGTIRGMHFQFPPAAETKLVRCTRGALLDIIVDLRPESETYLQHVAVELDAESMRALYVPERFAHGYQTLRDDTVASYELGEVYTPSAEGGLPHDDPRLGLSMAAAGDRNLGKGSQLPIIGRNRGRAKATNDSRCRSRRPGPAD